MSAAKNTFDGLASRAMLAALPSLGASRLRRGRLLITIERNTRAEARARHRAQRHAFTRRWHDARCDGILLLGTMRLVWFHAILSPIDRAAPDAASASSKLLAAAIELCC